MPSVSAMRHACCPPAAPKHDNAYCATSYPRSTEMRLIARAMLSTATRMKPSATASGVRPSPNFARKLCELKTHGLGVERLVAVFTENCRKELRPELAEHGIGVRDGQRAAAAIAHGARVSARALRSHAKAQSVVDEDRSSAGRNRMHRQHWHAKPRTCDFRFERALVFARKMRDVRRGPAHVEADDAVKPVCPCRLRHADDPACRPRENGIAPLKYPRRFEPARRRHELEARPSCPFAESNPETRST